MNFQALTDLAGGRLGVIDTVCPLCSHQRRPQNRRKRVLRLWVDTDAITFCCVHCGAKGYVLADNRRRLTEGGRERYEREGFGPGSRVTWRRAKSEQVAHAMGNTLSASNALFAIYVPVNVATLREVMTARRAGRRKLRT